MRGQLRERLDALLARARRIERRELRELRRWVERTSVLLHLSVLVFLPLLIGLVTLLSNRLDVVTFLLFPPLASGTYTLFANPESEYASPVRFVVGLTVGALCGWAALEIGVLLHLQQPSGLMEANAVEAALAMFLTAVVTWPLEVEEASAFSTALLGLLVPPNQEAAFAVSVFTASLIVASVFFVWRERFYEHRAEFLYESTKGDDHVLVPMRGENPDATATLGARLAAAHDAGKVVLLDLVDDEYVARAERDALDDSRRADTERVADGGGSSGDDARGRWTADSTDDGDAIAGPTEGETDDGDDGPRAEDGPPEDGAAGGGDEEIPAEALEDVAAERAVTEAATHLEERAGEIETRVGVPCEVVVAVAGRSPAATVLSVAREVNCDLIAAAYEQRHGALSPFLQDLFGGETDVVVHRSQAGRTRWRRTLVTVRRASDVAHSMLDFACRLVGRRGHVSVTTCVDSDRERRRAEQTLADLVEPFDGEFETRVSTLPIERYLRENGGQFDLVIMGASTDRSAASRFVSPPTFERVRELDADVAIVHRG